MNSTPLKLCIVNGSAASARKLHERLSELGHHVVAVHRCGAEALAGGFPGTDLALIDIHLAGEIDAVETANRLGHQHGIGIVLCASDTDPEVIERAGRIAPFGMLVEPFTNNELQVVLQTAHGLRKRERALLERNGTLERLLAERSPAGATISSDLLKVPTQRHDHPEENDAFRLLLHDAPIGIYRTTPDGRVLAANPAMVRMLGYSSFEALAKVNLENEGFHPNTPRREFKLQLEQMGQVRGLEAIWNRADGAQIWVRENAHVVRDANGEVRFYEGSAEDITERKQAEAALRESEERFRSLVETTSDWIWQVDQNGIYTYVSPRIRELLGYEPEEVLGRTPFDFMPPDEAKRIQAIFAMLVVQRAPIQALENVNLHKSGKRVVLETNGLPIIDADGELCGYRGVDRDVSERKRVDQAFRSKSDFLAKLIENAAEGVSVCQACPEYPHVRFALWNDRMVEITGYTLEEINRLGWYQMMYPDPGLQARAAARMERMRGGDNLKGEEWEITTKEGMKRTLAISTSVMILEDGTPAVVGLMHDITERKRAEQTMRESEGKLKEAQQLSHIGNWTLDLSTHHLEWSEEIFRIFEIEAAQFAASYEAFLEAVHPEDRERVNWAYTDSVQKRQPYSLEHRLLFADGRVKIVHAKCETVYAADGRALRSFGTVQDITERKRVEEAHAQLAAVVEQATEAIVITDTQGVIQYVNPAFERSTGYSSAEAIGRNPRIRKSGKHDADFYRQMWGTLLRGEVWRGRLINRRKGGDLYEEEAIISPVRDATGRIGNFVSVNRDVTREKQLESQLLQSQKLEAVGQLAGGIAHDFNNILTGVLNYTALAREDCPPELAQIHGYLGEVQACGNRAKDLVRRILLFSRAEDDRREPLLIHSVVREALALLRSTLPATVRIEAQLEARTAVVEANATQLHQVVMNLVINAGHALQGKPGRIDVRLSEHMLDASAVAALPGLKPGPHVRLEVTDTGCGMTSAVLARIYEPFYTTKPQGEGSGLGLSVVHGVIRSHQGGISVRSQPGLGTTFALYFPAQCPSAAVGVKSVGMQLDAMARGRGQRILLVDDEPLVGQPLELLLQRLGYHVHYCNKPEAALKAFRSAPTEWDLAIVDYQMPEMTGLMLAEKLLQHRPRIPVLIASGFLGAISNQSLSDRGMATVSVLAKPIALEQLAQALARVFEAEKSG